MEEGTWCRKKKHGAEIHQSELRFEALQDDENVVSREIKNLYKEDATL